MQILKCAMLLMMIAYVGIQDTESTLVTAKFTLLIAAIFQFLVAAALFCGAYSLYIKKVKEAKKKRPFWECVSYVMVLMAFFFLIGAFITFKHFLAIVKIIHEMEAPVLV